MADNIYRERINALRQVMAEEGIDFYIIPTADFHLSEYVAPYFRVREFLSGFTGSNGTLLIGTDTADLWTDGRYFVQAEKELSGTGITLRRMGQQGVPTLEEHLEKTLPAEGTIGFDGRCVPLEEAKRLLQIAAKKGGKLKTDRDLAETIWTGRPAMPAGPVHQLDEERLAGEAASAKLTRLRAEMKKAGAQIFITSRLDEIMWLLNIRGTDVECNPVALSHLFVGPEHFVLFLQDTEIDESIPHHIASCGGEIRSYGSFYDYVAEYDYQADEKVLLDGHASSYRVYSALEDSRIVYARSPIENFKAVKNATEIRNIRSVYRDDSAALTRFLYFMHRRALSAKETGGEYVTDLIDSFSVDGEDSLGAYLNEYTAAMRLDDMRRQIPDFVELSFPTISAYGANAAMMHYEATARDHADIRPCGMYLVDSGGQYLRGTTDVTRTIAMGDVTQDMIRHYTLTAIGMLRLQNAVFLKGCTGRNLDILAREPLWRDGTDYKCGTGHGIGYFLNVHEGPQRISWQQTAAPEAKMEAGMIVSDEPGVYLEGQYGIRIENILLTVEKCTSMGDTFLSFEPLTYVPLDRALIDPALMNDEDRRFYNDYQASVRETILPYLTDEGERAWLAEITAEI
ncbi:MAG: aminopeptidase P family protein [Lachnospiraceae bacterium]|nr:aminopeptidase P family protein [Lachnospiraceae bacterium]